MKTIALLLLISLSAKSQVDSVFQKLKIEKEQLLIKRELVIKSQKTSLGVLVFGSVATAITSGIANHYRNEFYYQYDNKTEAQSASLKLKGNNFKMLSVVSFSICSTGMYGAIHNLLREHFINKRIKQIDAYEPEQ